MSMKTLIFKTISGFILLSVLFACRQKPAGQHDPLPSWNHTDVKQKIINYVDTARNRIPVADRIAVFDMDGTVACETPLWFEMAVAVQGMMEQLEKEPSLLEKTEYLYAKKLSENPSDTSVLNHWVVNEENYLDSIIFKAFEQVDHESYIQYAREYLTNTKSPNGLAYAKLFYQPMLELIEYLKANQFTVYIVSGSMQGVIWSICPQTIGLDREHLIGTRQAMLPAYPETEEASFRIQKGIYPPKNDGDGKSLNIYSQIGKIPVFAFGNTTGDFGMFHLASTSKYPNIAILLNHDDPREYIYEPYHGVAVPHWQDSIRQNNWVQADMKQEFKTVWMTR